MCGWWGTATLAHIGKTLLLGELNRVADAMSSHLIGGYERVQAVLSIVIITVAAWYSDAMPEAKATDRRNTFRVILLERFLKIALGWVFALALLSLSGILISYIDK